MARHSYSREMYKFPLPHSFTFGFGLSIDDTLAAKQATIVPYLMQDNAIVDYETIKTNPENADFAVVAKPNVAAGSSVPKVMVSWRAFVPLGETSIGHLNFKTLDIHTAMLNRLDARDKKTGADIENILELNHETTDEQCYPLWNGTKLFEGHGVNDLPAEVPGLTTDQQPEGVDFLIDDFFNAMHYYTNKEMLRQVTGRMMNHTLSPDYVAGGATARSKVVNSYSNKQQSMCKYAHPYTFCGELFYAPLAGTHNQDHLGIDVTAEEHITVLGRVRFNEYNPDFNFSRA